MLRQAKARRVSVGYPLVILMIGLLSRLPLLGNYLGEPDTARYVFGLRFWINAGPGSGSIINCDLSSGYYWLAAELVRLFDVSYGQFPLLLNVISVVASVAAGLILYYLSLTFIEPDAAFAATVVFILAPSSWWAGIQPHPQALAAALVLLALLVFERAWRTTGGLTKASLMLATTVCFAASLLVKNDFVLLTAAFPAVVLFERAKEGTGAFLRSIPRAVLCSVVALGPAYLICSALKHLILGANTIAGVGGALQHIQRYFSVPHGREFVAQVTPMFFSHGVFALIAAAIGSVLWLRTGQVTNRLGWAAIIVFWTIPGYLFWILVAGNNVRHLMLLPIPLFWAAAQYARRRSARLLGASTLVVLALDFLMPPNSGLNLFPAPNVPASARLHRQKQLQLRAAAEDLLTGDGRRACYVGGRTLDHVSSFLLEQVDARGMRERLLANNQFRVNIYRDGAFFREVDMVPALRWPSQASLTSCDIVRTAEYASGERIRFFGGEWGQGKIGR